MDSSTNAHKVHLTQKQKERRGQLDINSSKFNVVLFRMGIAKVKIEDWIVLQRSRFEVTVDGEPYSALQLYFNFQNGDYLIRVWGKTHSKGNIMNSATEFESLCNYVFVQGLACCPGQIGNGVAESLVSVDYPFQRRISPDCAVFHLTQGSVIDNAPVDICLHCTSDTEAKIEIKEEASDTYVSLLKDPLNFYPRTEMRETTLGDTEDLKEDHTKYGIKKRKRNKEHLKKKAPKPIPSEPFEVKKTECEHCGTPIIEGGENDSLDLHYKECSIAVEKARQQVLSLIYSEPKKPKEPKKVNPEGPVVCHICGKEGTHKSMHQHMHRHKLEENPLQCPYSRCGTLFETEEATKLHVTNIHLRKHKFYCEICGLSCTDKRRLANHVQAVHKKMSLDIKCTECDEIFINESAMRRHRIIVHRPDKFKCNDCEKSFASSQQLRRHNIVHTGEKPLQCDECGKKLGKKGDLEDHIRTHTGEKPFACQLCPYKGSSKSLLYHHKKQKHKAEFAEERKQKEEAKIKISTTKNDGDGEDQSASNQDQSASTQDQSAINQD